MVIIILVHTLNSFAKDGKGGNPAGVVLGQSKLTLQSMQRTAREVGFSETVFILESSKADYRARFFTPNSEVDLCGHATIAAFALMSELGVLDKGKYKLETMAGILDVEIDNGHRVFMNQALPEFFDIVPIEEVAACFGASTDMFDEALPVQVVSTGLKDMMVPVKSLNTLLSLKPSEDKIIELSSRYNVVGLHAFTKETLSNSTAHCRNFAPLYAIPEEAATGTSNAALACYLWRHRQITQDMAYGLVFEQGYCMGNPSEIIAKLEISGDSVAAVKVGGNAVVTGRLEICDGV